MELNKFFTGKIRYLNCSRAGTVWEGGFWGAEGLDQEKLFAKDLNLFEKRCDFKELQAVEKLRVFFQNDQVCSWEFFLARKTEEHETGN